PALLKQFPAGMPAEFIASAALRPANEVARMRSIAELWHWRSRTKQLVERGAPFPGNAAMQAKGFDSFDAIVRFTADKAHADGLLPQTIAHDFAAFGQAYRSLSAAQWAQATSIATERHFALNWLCGEAPGNDWHRTPTST